MSADSPSQDNTLNANNGGLPAKERMPRSEDHRLIPSSDPNTDYILRGTRNNYSAPSGWAVRMWLCGMLAVVIYRTM